MDLLLYNFVVVFLSAWKHSTLRYIVCYFKLFLNRRLDELSFVTKPSTGQEYKVARNKEKEEKTGDNS
jgi:hypothetical protein